MKVIIKLSIILCCLLFVTEADAQIGLKQRFFTDFKVGVNSSEMDISGQNYGKKAKIGFHIGVSTSYIFYDNFHVQTGAYLTKKGMKQRLRDVQKNHETTLEIITQTTTTTDANYIQIPLLLGWETSPIKDWAFNINGGLYGAWGFKGDTKTRGTKSTKTGSENPVIDKINEKSDTFSGSVLKKFDYGLIGSVGAVYDIYTLSFSYEYGLYNISNDNMRDLKNRNFTLAIGFRF